MVGDAILLVRSALCSFLFSLLSICEPFVGLWSVDFAQILYTFSHIILLD